jgi:hypothetical protein
MNSKILNDTKTFKILGDINDIKSFNWSNHSDQEWTTYTEKFERTIFKIALLDRRIKFLLISLSKAFYPYLLPRYELYDTAYNYWNRLNSLESVDLNINMDLKFLDLFKIRNLYWEIAKQQLKPALIYSERLLVNFEQLEGMTIYIFEEPGITRIVDISIDELNIILFIMCRAKKIIPINFSNVDINNGNPITLGMKILTTIFQCCGVNKHLVKTQCIVHPINDPYYLIAWGRYGSIMLTHVTEITCRMMKEMLFYDRQIINALTESKQPFLNRFQILAISPAKPPIQQKSSWFDFHIVLTISEPLISRTDRSNEIKCKGAKNNTTDLQLLSRLKEIPNELKFKILGNLRDFNDHYCGCSSVGSTLTNCLMNASDVPLSRRSRMNFLFPISMRKRITPLHSKMTDIYLVLRAETTREPFHFSNRFTDDTFTLSCDGRTNAEVKIINRSHFNRLTYDMNKETLSILTSENDSSNSNYQHDTNEDKRDNPFFRKDSQFERVDICCELVS